MGPLLFTVILSIILYQQSVSANFHKFQNTLGHLKPRSTSVTQKNAVEDLIKRVLPTRYDEFSVKVDSELLINGKECYKIKNVNNTTIQIIGTTGVSAAAGFNHYLKYYCFAHISWELSQLNLPNQLPEVDITIALNDKFRYYQNVCTTSYSFVWWNWTKWEQHIDWMVMNSFNFILAFNGQEAIWERVYKKLNLTDQNIDEHFSGPAFLSWLRMGNLRGWGGPLSQSWHNRSLNLQHKILDRLRSFGVITILPGFAGHLPRAFKTLYPNVSMTQMGAWNNFPDKYCCPLFLDPTEELFQIVGQMFVEEQILEYGTDHVYNCDSFNEMEPTSDNLTYLAKVGQSIYGALKLADPDAIWMLQGWAFSNDPFWKMDILRAKSFLTSVPTGKMIILDLQSEQFPQYERLDQYFGQPYIWCMLHNFGGVITMYGSSDIINTEVIKARNLENSTMIGTGLSMEGINQNYVIYDLMIEQSWRNQSIDLANWFKNYSRRRYGNVDENLENSWEIMRKSLYNYKGINRIGRQFIITQSPSLHINTWTWYDFPDLIKAWKLFLSSSDNFHDNPGYLHDLVDLTRQVLQDNGDIYYNKLIPAFNMKNLTEFQQMATILRGIFLDLESILATNEAFLLGKWLEDAKSLASNSNEEKLFEFNARNQISLWGPSGEIINYAIKQWSGMVKDFLYPRWDEFIYGMNFSLINNVKFDESLEKVLIYVLYEQPFVYSRDSYPAEPVGNSIEIAKAIANRTWYTTSENIPQIKIIPMRKRKVKKFRNRCIQYSRSDLKKIRRSFSKIRDASNGFNEYFSNE